MSHFTRTMRSGTPEAGLRGLTPWYGPVTGFLTVQFGELIVTLARERPHLLFDDLNSAQRVRSLLR